MLPTSIGTMIFGTVAHVFVMPIKTLAYFGAISKWFTPKPAQPIPDKVEENHC